MFKCSKIKDIYSQLKSGISKVLQSLEKNNIQSAEYEVEKLLQELEQQENKLSKGKDIELDEFFILKQQIFFFKNYVNLWNKIFIEEYGESWVELQNCLDKIRLIKKFLYDSSFAIIQFFESQLLELEQLYPYKIFMSTSLIVDYYKCSICGKDIDSNECEHIKGELYRGKIACGIANKIRNMNHIAMVKYPSDKRCVEIYDNRSEQFKLVRYLSDSLRSNKLNVISFHHLKFKKGNKKNKSIYKQGRNDLCQCGSGKKFKKCCQNKMYVVQEHVDIVGQPTHIKCILA